MKKFNFEEGQKLSREEMKRVSGGFKDGGGNGGPCVENGCSRICFYSTYDGGTYGYGNCNTQGEMGHPSICDNYCCEAGKQTYWC